VNWRVLFTDRSLAQVEKAQGWWDTNRPLAPALFREEMEHAVELLRSTPRIGRPFPRPEAPDLRVLVLRRTRFLVYYIDDAEQHEVLVVAVWSSLRGADPPREDEEA